MDVFKIPNDIPQDLLLIQDIVGVPVVEPAPSLQVSPANVSATNDDDSSGPDSNVPSEDEIHAELIVQDEDNGGDQCVFYFIVCLVHSLTWFSRPISSSDSDSESDTDSETNIALHNGLDGDEHSDEDQGVASPKGTYFQTKNELLENEIVVPDIQHVEPEEHLEKVGEIISVVGNLAIVKGAPSDVPNRGAERALDSNTLLVFEDRSVMGYVSNS